MLNNEATAPFPSPILWQRVRVTENRRSVFSANIFAEPLREGIRSRRRPHFSMLFFTVGSEEKPLNAGQSVNANRYLFSLPFRRHFKTRG